MKERPILFSGAMIRALLDNRKTQTRRVLKPQPEACADCQSGYLIPLLTESPYWDVDRLWVRETFWAYGRWETSFNEKKGRDELHFIDMTHEYGRQYKYQASTPDNGPRDRRGPAPAWHRRPSIHMPRWASRITLEIAGVRVDRVQDISDEDAVAEGVRGDLLDGSYSAESTFDPRSHFSDLWDSINAARGFGWSVNPWVWVIEFKRIT